MNSIVWSGDLETGNHEIDDQHKLLFKLIGDTYDAMEEGKGPMAVRPTLLALGEYAASHFQMEEEMMRDNGYPEWQAHKARHGYLTSKVLQLLDDVNSGEKVYIMEVVILLSKWLRDHINIEDKKFTMFMKTKAKGIAQN